MNLNKEQALSLRRELNAAYEHEYLNDTLTTDLWKRRTLINLLCFVRGWRE